MFWTGSTISAPGARSATPSAGGAMTSLCNVIPLATTLSACNSVDFHDDLKTSPQPIDELAEISP